MRKRTRDIQSSFVRLFTTEEALQRAMLDFSRTHCSTPWPPTGSQTNNNFSEPHVGGQIER